MIQDSGDRTQFETGAVRDIGEGKGDFTVMPLDVVSDSFSDDCNKRIFSCFDSYLRFDNVRRLYTILSIFCDGFYNGDIYTMFLEVSIHFEEGMKKYGRNNWRNGIPKESYVNSAIRHYLKFRRGDKDERHDRAFVWNVLCLIWTEENIHDGESMGD